MAKSFFGTRTRRSLPGRHSQAGGLVSMSGSRCRMAPNFSYQRSVLSRIHNGQIDTSLVHLFEGGAELISVENNF
jgi:hypothetical protein